MNKNNPRAEVSFDLESRIPEISVPALIVSGEEDKVVPAEDSRKLNDMLPDSTLHFIPETGHLSHEESPELFLEIVLPWIDNVTAKGALKLNRHNSQYFSHYSSKS